MYTRGGFVFKKTIHRRSFAKNRPQVYSDYRSTPRVLPVARKGIYRVSLRCDCVYVFMIGRVFYCV